MSQVAAILFGLASTTAVAFQLALALGAPLGRYALGGRFPGPLPPPMRIAAVVQAAIIAGLAVIVLSASGLVVPALASSVRWLIWLVVAFSAVSLVLNLVTPSAVERRIWAPVALVMLGSSLAVAVAGR